MNNSFKFLEIKNFHDWSQSSDKVFESHTLFSFCSKINAYYRNPASWLDYRLAPVLKTIFHHRVISYTCSQSNSGGSVLKQSHQSRLATSI